MNDFIEAIEALMQEAARVQREVEVNSDTQSCHAVAMYITNNGSSWIGQVAHARALVEQSGTIELDANPASDPAPVPTPEPKQEPADEPTAQEPATQKPTETPVETQTENETPTTESETGDPAVNAEGSAS